MIAATFRLELRRSRTLVLWLAVVAIVYGGLIAALFPVLRDNTKQMEDLLKLYPKEFLAAFGMEGSLADHGVFFTTYIGSFLWPVMAAIAGIIVATRTTAADVDRGWIELPLATPAPRVSYLASAVVAQMVVLAVLATTCVLGVLAVGLVVGAGFDAARFLLVVPVAFGFGCAIASVTTLLGTLTLSRGAAGGIAAGILIAMYLLRIVAQIQPDLASLGTFGIFEYFDPTPIIDTGAFPLADFGVLAVVSILAWSLALLVFRRRDLVT